MKNLLTISLTLISLLFTVQTYSQLSSELAPQTAIKKKKQNSNKLFFLTTDSYLIQVKGKQFYKNDDFVEGVIIDFENESINVKVRYRYADDEMQIFHLNKIKAIFPSKVKQIIFNDGSSAKTFIPAQYLEKKVKNYGYFELISKGKISLLKAHKKKGQNGTKSKLFYLENGEHKLAAPISNKKSKVLNVFGDMKSEMAKYASRHSLNPNNSEDLAKIFNYYNSKYTN